MITRPSACTSATVVSGASYLSFRFSSIELLWGTNLKANIVISSYGNKLFSAKMIPEVLLGVHRGYRVGAKTALFAPTGPNNLQSRSTRSQTSVRGLLSVGRGRWRIAAGGAKRIRGPKGRGAVRRVPGWLQQKRGPAIAEPLFCGA